MKTLTKEWLKDFELSQLGYMLDSREVGYLPIVVFNNGKEENNIDVLHRVKTNFNLPENEKVFDVAVVPNTFGFFDDYPVEEMPFIKSPHDDFMVEYINRLRIASGLPQEVLSHIKDLRLFALGCYEEEAKNAVLKYIGNKKEVAYRKYEKSFNDGCKVAEHLSANKQFKKHRYVNSLFDLFEEAYLVEMHLNNGDMQLRLNQNLFVRLSDCKIIEREAEPEYDEIKAFELLKNGSRYELHLLLIKRDSNLIESPYYITFEFSDMFLN